MLSFLTPGYWIALAGLLIPLAIHLWNRRKGRTVKVGSIELLELAEEKRLSSLKLSDIWRLLLRLLVLGCFVFLLMQPFWEKAGAKNQVSKWALIGKDYIAHLNLTSITDSLEREGYGIRTFTSGFPTLEKTPAQLPTENYWSLFQEIEHLNSPPDSLFIIAYPSQRYFNGSRPSLNIPVQWKTLPLASPEYFLVKAWQNKENINLIVGKSTEESTSFDIRNIPFSNQENTFDLDGYPQVWVKNEHPESAWLIQFTHQPEKSILLQDSFQLEINLLFDPDFSTDKTYLEAGLQAIGQYLDLEVRVDAQPSEEPPAYSSGWLFWLSEYSVPDSLRDVFLPNLAIYSPDFVAGKSYFAKAEEGYALQRRLTERSATELAEQLPHDLLAMLFEHSHKRAVEYGNHALAINQVLPDTKAKNSVVKAEPQGSPKPLFLGIWIVLILLFVWERLF